jgi:hypothetical protein
MLNQLSPFDSTIVLNKREHTAFMIAHYGWRVCYA